MSRSYHVEPCIKVEQARALSHFVQSILRADNPQEIAIVRRHLPHFATVRDALDAAEAIDAALLADEIDTASIIREAQSA